MWAQTWEERRTRTRMSCIAASMALLQSHSLTQGDHWIWTPFSSMVQLLRKSTRVIITFLTVKLVHTWIRLLIYGLMTEDGLSPQQRYENFSLDGYISTVVIRKEPSNSPNWCFDIALFFKSYAIESKSGLLTEDLVLSKVSTAFSRKPSVGRWSRIWFTTQHWWLHRH